MLLDLTFFYLCGCCAVDIIIAIMYEGINVVGGAAVTRGYSIQFKQKCAIRTAVISTLADDARE